MKLRWPIGLLCILLASLFVDQAALAENPKHPNLIWIMADDLGYGELGCFGQKTILTPELDQMAAQGMRLNHFYAGATVCAPSRSVLMTGLHHGHTRVRGNAGKANPKAQALREDDVTIAKVLQQSGYHTALIGKWGLGDIGEAESGLPNRQGFDEFYGFLNQTHAHNHFPDYLWRNDRKELLSNVVTAVGDSGGGYATEKREYADDLFAEEAYRFVHANRDKPFFLYWSMVVPHANNERNRELKNGAEVPDFGFYENNEWPAQDKGHAAMITRMDSYVGRMLVELEELGIANNTLVIFTSDNGPHNESSHSLKRFQPSGPFTGIKRSLTDGGIRVPCICWWPGKIKAGSQSNHVAYFGDWFATACDLAGTKLPDGLDSKSFTPSLLNQPSKQTSHEFLYWEFHEGGFHQAALYQGQWKGIRSTKEENRLRLYDLRSDIQEKNDVAASNPEIVKRIEAYLASARTDSEDWLSHP